MIVFEKLIKKVVIIGKVDEREKIKDFIKSEDLRMIQSGPKPLGNGSKSHDEIKWVAEKEIRLLPSKISMESKGEYCERSDR